MLLVSVFATPAPPCQGSPRPPSQISPQKWGRAEAPTPGPCRLPTQPRLGPSGMMQSMKGIILAGGTGSRLYPLTRITNKHLLPIGDRPMVVYSIDMLVSAGISEAMLVTGGTHTGEFLRLLGNGQEWGLERLLYAYQERPGGIAQALALAERFAHGEKVMVLLADNIFERSLRASVLAFEAQHEGSRIVLSEIDDHAHLADLGVAKLVRGRVAAIVEKPSDPPSNYAVTGAYFYEPSVFDVVGQLSPSTRGELEITDVNNHFIASGTLEFDIIEGFWGDAGESIDDYYRVNDFVRRYGANK